MESYELERERQRDAAARRVEERTEARQEHEAVLARPGGLAAADTPERIAKRIDRLSRYYAGSPVLRTNGVGPGKVLEKIINTADFVGARYLDAGVAAARAVGRVNIRDAAGRLEGYGTASLVSSALLLTNHHVLPDAATARSSVIEFDYQDGVDGKPLPTVVHPLDPDRFFLADEERDFALVAVRATPAELAHFGFNRLIEDEGKAIIGEFVTIVQHPRGDKKQVALRENRIVDIPDRFLHYSADTEPGSSGSPVFNDQWEVVALHHASVPLREQGQFTNEGIRISRVCRFVREAQLAPAQRELADGIFAPGRVELVAPAPASPARRARRPGGHDQRSARDHRAARRRHGRAARARARGGRDRPRLRRPRRLRPGVPRPAASAPVPGPGVAPDASAELRYHHFSVVMHRRRGLALFTAVNVDGKQLRPPERTGDRWFLDPRLPATEQTGEPVYRHNPLDRGHLVRRRDPAWGETDAIAKAANDDTFHFTNAAPQHHAFNAGQTLWVGLEDYVLGNAETHDLAVSVFTGPVLADDDDVYRGIQLPRQFWKLVAMVTTERRAVRHRLPAQPGRAARRPPGRRVLLVRRLPYVPGAGAADRRAL